jgi:hypothetical protein
MQSLRCCITDSANEDENATGVTPSLLGRGLLHDWRLEMSVQETGDCLRNPKRGHYLDLTITSADRADG